MKKLTILITTILLLIICSFTASALEVYVDDVKLKFNTYPYTMDGNAFIPISEICEQFGAIVDFKDNNQMTITTKDGAIIKLFPNDLIMYKNEDAILLDHAPQLENKELMVSPASLSEILSCPIGWDSTDGRVSIIKDTEEYTLLYTPDGRSRSILSERRFEKLAEGWYESPVKSTPISNVNMDVATATKTSVKNISVYLNGEKIEFDVQPQIINGRTMVPMRKIFEQLGATVEWEQTTKTITGKKEDTTIVMQINNNELSVNDNTSTLDVAPIVIDGRTLVPVRAIAESFGIDVLWYGDIKTVAIYNNTDSIEKKNLYNLSGNRVEIDTNFEENYLALGWSTDIRKIETVCMYAADGRTKYVHIGDVADEIALGWYTEPIVTMYALDGRTQIVKKSDVEENKKVGWYETKAEVVQNVYSITGAKEVYKAEVATYLQQGWREQPYPIALTDNCSFKENSVNGIELYWQPKNMSGKTINYYTTTIYFFNSVKDLAYDEITGKPFKIVKYVGPVEPNKDLLIYQIVGYVGACDYVVVGDITLEYSDGTKDEFWCGQVAKEGNIFSDWCGIIIPEP